MTRRNLAIAACVALLVWLGLRFNQASPWPMGISDQAFWDMVVTFSEPGRPFRSSGAVRTDNLISNELSFQQVIPALQNVAHRGAYLGVGPEQNFSYITALKPTIAFIIDIRRDNMLLHLMYKALAELSANRVEFLSHLFSRSPPAGLKNGSSIQVMLEAFGSVSCSEELEKGSRRAVFDRLERVHRFTLSGVDEDRITEAHLSFCVAGPAIRWDSSGDAWIPTYADLMVQTDPHGQPHSYLASEGNFRALKQYETDNRIVPLVGDFGGHTTIPGVSRYLKTHHATVAAFYTSNVEGYLGGDARTTFVENVAKLPLDAHSTFIRTRFSAIGYVQNRPVYQTSTVTNSMLEWVDTFKSRENR